eukprot:109247-Rhodomonas_salina.4
MSYPLGYESSAREHSDEDAAHRSKCVIFVQYHDSIAAAMDDKHRHISISAHHGVFFAHVEHIPGNKIVLSLALCGRCRGIWLTFGFSLRAAATRKAQRLVKRQAQL